MKLVQSYVCTGSYYAQLEWTPRPFRLKKYVLYYTLFVYKTCGILFMYYLQNIVVIQNGILSHFLPPNKLALNKIRQKNCKR